MALRETLERDGEWLFRRRSYLPLVVLAGVVGTVLAHPHPLRHPGLAAAWEVCCVAVSLLGVGVRVLVAGHAPDGTSGRNTHGQVAEVLNTSGAYSVVRHALYVGNYLMWLGPALFTRRVSVPLVITLVYWLYYERIMLAEEAFLRARFGDAFERWAARTPAVLPRLRTLRRDWRLPALPFSGRTVLRREYSGVFGVAAVFTLLELASDTRAAGHPALVRAWAVAFAASGVAYLVLRTIKRSTRLLHVPGR